MGIYVFLTTTQRSLNMKNFKIFLLFVLTFITYEVQAKQLYCTEQFIGVVTTADGAEFPAEITPEETLYKNLVVDNGDSFIVTLNKGYKLKSGKLKLNSEGVLESEHNGLTYRKRNGNYYVGETDHEPRYREWSVYKNCK